jgi:hypothetical protein
MKADSEPEPDHDILDMAGYDEVHRRHIFAIGIIADQSAQMESVARWMLCICVGISNSATVDAMFLGDRMNALYTRIAALAKADPLSVSRASAATWTRQAKSLTDERDQLMHRPVREHRLMRGRRSQTVEVLNNQAVDLAREMEIHISAGLDIAFTFLVDGEHG